MASWAWSAPCRRPTTSFSATCACPCSTDPGSTVLQRERPDMVERLAFITGDTLSMEIQSFLNQTNVPYLEKPFLPDDVLRLLGQALARRGPAPAASAGRVQRVS